MYTIRDDVVPGVNHPKDEILKQIRRNIRRHLPQVRAWPVNDYRAMVLAGGPTLADHWQQIKRKRKNGWKVITMNNTHEAALDHGGTPSMFVMLDARPHNARFVERPQADCHYLLCNQVHPDVYDALDGYNVHIWHAGGENRPEIKILNRHYLKRWLPMTGGTSVGPRAIWLGYVHGIRRFDVYGMDSCLVKDRHHAYEQPENDFSLVLKVKASRRTFYCHAWMVKQADEWIQFLNVLPKDVQITMHGDGLLTHITQQIEKTGRVPKIEVLDTMRSD